MSKKIVLLISIALIMAMVFSFSLAGCKEEAAEEEVTEETVEEEAVEEEVAEEEITSEPMIIDLWAHSGNPADAFMALADLYTAEHPNITFNMTTHTVDNYKIVSPLAIQNGQEKLDIIWYWASLASDWPTNGWVLDLKEYLDSSVWDDVVDGAINQYTTSEGNIYFTPQAGHFLGLLFYNTDIFEELGIEMGTNIPASEDDFIEICDKLNQAGYEGVSIGNVGKSWMTHITTALIAQNMSPEEESTAGYWASLSKEEQLEKAEIWKSDAVIDGFKVLDKYAKAGCFIKDANIIDWDPARELFVEGKAAMFMDGTWGINLIRDMADEDFNFSVSYLAPNSDGNGQISSKFGGGYAVPSYVKEKSPEKIPVIMDFLSKQYTEEYYIAAMEVQQGVPASKNLPEEYIDANYDPVLKKIISDAGERGMQLYLTLSWDAEFSAKFADVSAAVLGQTMTPEEAANELYEIVVKLAEERE